MRSYTSRPIDVSGNREASAAELVFRGVEQAGPSFEGRVFLNNPAADETTPTSPEAGYAGSFHVFGYGPAAPPEMTKARARRQPGGPAVAPIEKRLQPDEAALRRALAGSGDLEVTVVPIPVDPGGEVPDLPFEHVDVLFDP